MISVEGLDKIMNAGLGRRYAFIGPIEVAHLNANGKKNSVYLLFIYFIRLSFYVSYLKFLNWIFFF